MSLEAAIQALTAAVQANTEALKGAAVASPAASAVPASEPEKRGPGRPKKTDTAADMGPVLAGDAEGTTYWFSSKHQSAVKLGPTDSLGPVSDRKVWEQITGAAFVEKQQALAAQFPASAPNPSPAPAPAAAAPTPPSAALTPAAAPAAPGASAPTYNDARTALLELAKSDPAKGRDRVIAILKAQGCNSVPELEAEGAAAFAAVIAATKPPAAGDDALFG